MLHIANGHSLTALKGGVLLHGRGQPYTGMLLLADRIGLDGVRWIAPRAEGGQWYPHRFMGPLATNEPALSAALAECDAALDRASDGGRIQPPDRIVLGFSQGACLASEYVLRHPGRCGTLIMFTGGLIGPDDRQWATSDHVQLTGLRVLITGSDADEWVPEARVRRTADVLSSLGADVQLRIYAGRPHLVSDDEIALARALINGTYPD